MCSSGNPFLCCGKSNRQRCVPLTSLIQSSAPDSCAAARVPATDSPAVAAVPITRPMKLRRCKSELAFMNLSCNLNLERPTLFLLSTERVTRHVGIPVHERAGGAVLPRPDVQRVE